MDDKKTTQGQDDSFNEHELDLNTPEDLEAIEDITFAEPSKDSMAIFEDNNDFNDFNDFSDFDDFSQSTFEDTNKASDKPYQMDEITADELGYRPENTANELLNEEAFDFKSDEEIFSSDAFEDVNADFPESERSSNLGDSQLFDYDPSTAASEETIESEAPYAATKQGGGSGGAGGSGGSKNFMNSRRAIRLVLLIVLAGAIYGVLRIFTGSGEDTLEMAQPNMEAPLGKPAPIESSDSPVIAEAEISAPTETLPPTESIETVETIETVEVAESVSPVPTAPTPVTPTPVTPTPVTPTPVTPTPVTPTPVTPTPVASAPISPPQTSFTVGTSPSMAAPNDQIASKLNTLEASLQAIDNRLSALSAYPQGSVAASMKSPAAQSVSEDQALMEALEKINRIDRKISHLSELQAQIQSLNREVNALKNDVVQQSMIVGQNQSQLNQNINATQGQHAPKMFVQAAIPGRAWLRSEVGQLMTVIPGDEVPGYGRVISIDATKGTVVMSSHTIFREQ